MKKIKNKEFKKLEEKYGKGIYELFSYFKSIQVYTYEGDGSRYLRTTIAYPHTMKNSSDSTVEMVDIITGEKYPTIDEKNSIYPKISSLGYRVNDVLDIDEHLFEVETQKDEMVRSTVTYDITNFDKTVRYMKNFVLTTDGFTNLNHFERLALTPKEIDEQKKNNFIRMNINSFLNMRTVKTCGVLSIQQSQGKRRKSKLKWYCGETIVPVYVNKECTYAIDLRDGVTKYEILDYVVIPHRFFSPSVELSDEQYDRIYERILNDTSTEHYYIHSIGDIDFFAPHYFSYEQLKEILSNYQKVVVAEKNANSSKKYQKK